MTPGFYHVAKSKGGVLGNLREPGEVIGRTREDWGLLGFLKNFLRLGSPGTEAKERWHGVYNIQCAE